MKVLVSDPIAPDGIEILKKAGLEVLERPGMSKEELFEAIRDVEAIIIRSATKVTAEVIEAAKKLKLIARAGTGLDNVDIPAANQRGIVVMNCPGGNTISAAEHTISMMLSLARNIPQATASMKAGKWEKKKFMGREITGKTLGIIGLGRIGSVVADRAKGLKMRVIAYDPYVNPDQAARMGIEVMSLEELLPQADFITVHVPLTKETRGFINKEVFDKMKEGVMFIHCARGGIVNEADLYEALKSGKVAGAALDVFEQEPPPEGYPLLQLDNVICTPHLGASTIEAQKNVALTIASQVVDYLLKGVVRNAVNVPSVSAEQMPLLKPFLILGEKLGALQAQLVEGPIQEVHIEYQGDVAALDTKPISVALLKGMLTPALQEDVNYVNAPIRAKERGIKVTESTTSETEDFLNLIRVKVKYANGEMLVAGTIFGKKEPRIVQIDDFRLDAVPEGHMLFIMNEDRPGVIGSIGIAIGEEGVNISRMYVGQEPAQKCNIILLSLDAEATDDLVHKVASLPYVLSVKALEL